MDYYFSIGDVAKLKGVTIKALRFYDKIDLIKPAYINPENGYRYYTIDQLLPIEHIRLFKMTGASLDEISKVFHTKDCTDIAEFYMDQIEKADEKIAQLQEAKQLYQQIISRVYYDKSRTANKEVYFRSLPTRYVLSHPCQTPPTDRETYFHYFDAYSLLREKKLSCIYATGSIVNVNRENYDVSYEKMYVEVEKTNESLDIELQTLPPGDYICINYFEENKKEQLETIFKAIDDLNLIPKLIIEADTLTEIISYENPLMELQILI